MHRVTSVIAVQKKELNFSGKRNTMYKYAEEGVTDTVVRISDGKIIKIGMSDPFSKAVQLWMSRGNTPHPADPVRKVMEPMEPMEDPSHKAVAADGSTPDQQPEKKTKKWRELLEKS